MQPPLSFQPRLYAFSYQWTESYLRTYKQSLRELVMKPPMNYFSTSGCTETAIKRPSIPFQCYVSIYPSIYICVCLFWSCIKLLMPWNVRRWVQYNILLEPIKATTATIFFLLNENIRPLHTCSWQIIVLLFHESGHPQFHFSVLFSLIPVHNLIYTYHYK